MPAYQAPIKHKQGLQKHLHRENVAYVARAYKIYATTIHVFEFETMRRRIRDSNGFVRLIRIQSFAKHLYNTENNKRVILDKHDFSILLSFSSLMSYHLS